MRIASLAEAIRAAVAPDRAAIAALAAAAEVGLSSEQKLALAAMAKGEAKIDDALADRGAAILRILSEDDPSRRRQVLQALRPAALARFRWKAPPGAKWANHSGCGTEVEGEDTGLVTMCGMGYVPEASRRFLWFFADR